MHTTEVGTNNVPAFLIKLWKLVEDEDTNDLICWSPDGRSFYIHNQTQFAKELLPLYFKHNNMTSFIRQLNMYGFRKVASIDQGALKSDRDDLEFFHSFFIRGQECMLEFIKRKVPSARNNTEDSRARSDMLKELLSDVGSMQGRQEHVDQLLTDMKKENEALWREVAMLRQKHIKQQQIVDKLIQFLVSMVQGNRNITVKRKLPLMLQDSPSSSSKIPRLKKSQFGSSTDYQVSSPASLTMESPMIHDVTDIIEDVTDPNTLVTGSPTIRMGSTLKNSTSTNNTPPPASPSSLGAPAPPPVVGAVVELDTPPIVAMPMDPTEPIEPLSLMEALSDPPAGIYILPDSSEEVEVSSASDMNCGSSISIAPTTASKAVATTDGIQAPKTSETGSTPCPKSAGKPAAASNDLLSSCIALENIPLMPKQTASSSEITQESDSKRKQSKDVASVANHTAVVREVSSLPQNTSMQVALQDRNTAASPARAFSDHLEGIDTELDWLQDQLMSGGLNIDSTTLMGVCPDWRGISNDLKLFGSDDPLANCLGDLVSEGRDTETVGNEVVQYTPSLLDLQAIDDDQDIFDPALNTTKTDSVSSTKSDSPLQTPVSESVDIPLNLTAGSKKGPGKKRRSRK